MGIVECILACSKFGPNPEYSLHVVRIRSVEMGQWRGAAELSMD